MAGPCGLAWGRCGGVHIRWVYERRWGRWFLRDKTVAQILGWSTRSLNRRAARLGAALPPDFAHRMTEGRFHFAFPPDRAQPRPGGRAPWVYSLPGMLMLRIRHGEDETPLLRMLADLADALPGPVPPELKLPRAPRQGDAPTPAAPAVPVRRRRS